MTKRERVEATLNFEEPDRIPIYDLLRNDKVISHYAQRGLTIENGLETVLEAMSNCLDMTRSIKVPQKEGVVKKGGYVYKVERWMKWTLKRPFGTVNELESWIEKEITRLNQSKTWDVSARSLVTEAKGLKEYAESFRESFIWRKKRLKGTVELLTGSPVGLGTAYEAAGFDLFVYLYAENPELVSAWLEALNRVEIKRVHAIADYELSPVALVHTDIAFKGTTLFSPQFLRKEFFHRLKRLVNAWHEHSIKCLFHSDGNLMAVLSDLIDARIDGLNPIESVAGMNLKEVKELCCDKVFLAGGIDVSDLLPHGTKEEVERGVIRAIKDAGHGSGFFLGSTTEVGNGVPLENFIAMIEAVYKHGRYPLKV